MVQPLKSASLSYAYHWIDPKATFVSDGTKGQQHRSEKTEFELIIIDCFVWFSPNKQTNEWMNEANEIQSR